MTIQSPAVRVIECDSWSDFRTALRRNYSESLDGSIGWLFRGHAHAEWKLASPWERYLAHLSPGARMSPQSAAPLAKLLADFKDMAIGLPGIRAADFVTEDDWWTLGRHFGLVTPLLDWSRSPYVAAFFAFTGLLERQSPGSTTTGAINVPGVLENSEIPLAIWSLAIDEPHEHLRVVQSRSDMGHRQRAQRGVFTRLDHETFLSTEDYLESLCPSTPPLCKYIVPGRAAPEALTELRMMNITFATLFPDLTGAALQANFEMVTFALEFLYRLSPESWEHFKERVNAAPKS